MKNFLFVILMLIAFSLSAQTSKTLLHNSLTRSYIECVPAIYTGQDPVPLVIALHGLGDNMTNFSGVGFHALAQSENFITLYPQAQNSVIGTLWNAGCIYMGYTLNTNVMDVDFINALIDTTSILYNIDPERIYVTGFSMGGFMAQRYACECSNRVAAIASVAGTRGRSFTCAPLNPVPVFHLHGTDDATIPMVANPYGIDTDSLIEYWVEFNLCEKIPVFTQLPDIANDSMTVEYYHYADSASSAETDFYKVIGADHQWLQTPYNDVDYTTEIWNFFKKHSLSTINPPIHYNIYAPYIYPNPASDYVQIMNLKYEAAFFSVADSGGRQIIENQKMKSNNKINISSLQDGIYFVTLYYKDSSKGHVTVKMNKTNQ